MYDRDVILPLYTLLKPRIRYSGGNQHKIILQEQYKASMTVHQCMKDTKKKQRIKQMKRSEEASFQVGDTAYYKNNKIQNKLDKMTSTRYDY